MLTPSATAQLKTYMLEPTDQRGRLDDDDCGKESAFGIIAGQEFDCAEPIIFLLPVHTFNLLNLQFPEFLADTCDTRDCRSAQIRRSSRLHRTTGYATVLLPLPGVSNDLEVVRLL